MTVLAAFAYSLITFGPPVSLFFVTVVRQPHEIIAMIVGSFFWLLSFFLSAVIWIIVPPLRSTPAFTLPLSVILQELFRWFYFKLLNKADYLLEVVSNDKSELRKHKIGYVGGLGFGLIAGIVLSANVLEAATGPGVVGIREDDDQYFVLVSALGAQVMILLHICWGVLYFAGWEKRNWLLVVMVPVTHMFISALSVMNNYKISPAYFLVAGYVLFAVLSVLTFFVAGGRPKTLLHFFKLKLAN